MTYICLKQTGAWRAFREAASTCVVTGRRLFAEKCGLLGLHSTLVTTLALPSAWTVNTLQQVHAWKAAAARGEFRYTREFVDFICTPLSIRVDWNTT
ncbi:hypothetical protein P3T43_006213 [Paraburkholderia sp. GAS41]